MKVFGLVNLIKRTLCIISKSYKLKCEALDKSRSAHGREVSSLEPDDSFQPSTNAECEDGVGEHDGEAKVAERLEQD